MVLVFLDSLSIRILYRDEPSARIVIERRFYSAQIGYAADPYSRLISVNRDMRLGQKASKSVVQDFLLALRKLL